ncbi:MAG: MerR family transcriptional regulator [Microbacterium sp.]|uniref:MerR family transcriptional regulator n=1 Tax=Microbacterium sp. TaxID=51671 RepID=UPI003F959F3E
MAWSTRELAGLAGTTVNTIRHYERVGLMIEPERKHNGYKQYGVQELVCLLRILRLVALGVPLAKITDLGADGQDTRMLLQEQNVDLARRIRRLQRARADVTAILRHDAPPDSPTGFVPVASLLSESDRSLLHISNQLYDDAAMVDLRQMMESDANGGVVGKEIDALPADADEVTRKRLAAGLAPILVQHMVDYPWLTNPAAHLSKSERATKATFVEALAALYNPAQLDVLARAGQLAQAQFAHEQLNGDDWMSDEVDHSAGMRQA